MASDALLIVSNRGPVRYLRGADGGLVSKRGGGGLVTALSALAGTHPLTWIASALSDEDAEAAAERRHRVGGSHPAAGGARPRGVRPLLQRVRKPHALVHPALPVGALAAAVGRSKRAACVGGGLRAGQPPVRRRRGGGAQALAGPGDGARLPALHGARARARAGARGGHPALHAHPVAAARLLADPAARHPHGHPRARSLPATSSACTRRATCARSWTASRRSWRAPRSIARTTR